MSVLVDEEGDEEKCDDLNITYDHDDYESDDDEDEAGESDSDHSQTAYGCVAYYNWKLENGERASDLAMSKAKPWPQIPTLTIPRGELLGCLLGARMQQTIVKKSSFIFQRVMLLTDSTIVLGQLRHEPYKYNMWTASRISEIQTLTDIRDWYHVDSGNNVADDA
ncbi:uncharacterized protein [Palaemon carinicauda]|uniref:uncharacterized protein n=1 Tax=Palaemon carinicauda TaxID=392227 RepID=UPI0035B5714B